jgi:hypothetical protein
VRRQLCAVSCEDRGGTGWGYFVRSDKTARGYFCLAHGPKQPPGQIAHNGLRCVLPFLVAATIRQILHLRQFWKPRHYSSGVEVLCPLSVHLDRRCSIAVRG